MNYVYNVYLLLYLYFINISEAKLLEISPIEINVQINPDNMKSNKCIIDYFFRKWFKEL
jgi:hypothetical protein